MVQTFSEIQEEFFRDMGDIVYATMTTVDAKGRPRAKILIAVWEVIDGRPGGWLATFKTPVKTAHLAGNPHARFSYWDPRQNAAFADTVAGWVEDPEAKQRVWELYRRGSPPRVGYDPGRYWRGQDDPKFRRAAPGPVARSGGAGRGPEQQDLARRDPTDVLPSLRSSERGVGP